MRAFVDVVVELVGEGPGVCRRELLRGLVAVAVAPKRGVQWVATHRLAIIRVLSPVNVQIEGTARVVGRVGAAHGPELPVVAAAVDFGCGGAGPVREEKRRRSR